METSKNKIIAEINSAQWYHSFEIYPGIYSPGKNKCQPDIYLDRYGVPKDLNGKKALDIGAWDGPYAFELENRGADTTALDIHSPENTGFSTAKKIKDSGVRYIRNSVYDLNPSEHGTFDVVLFLGVYYHLKNPLLALRKIYSVMKPNGILYFEGAILDNANYVDEICDKNFQRLRAVINLPVALFVKDKYSDVWSNWYVPTAVCLDDWMAASGFEVLNLDVNVKSSRAYGSARKLDDFSENEHPAC